MAVHPTQHADSSTPPPDITTSKPIHSLILDTGPLIKNDPSADVLIAKSEKLYTLPSIISEIRDPMTRSRVETTLLPFVTLRSPKTESLKFIANFAKRTGDYGVLSRPDMEVLALGYELECERNGGDWRLRNTPGQKSLNGRPQQDKPASEQGKYGINKGDQVSEQLEQTESTDGVQEGQADIAQEEQGKSQTRPEFEADLNANVQNLSLKSPKSNQAPAEATEVEQLQQTVLVAEDAWEPMDEAAAPHADRERVDKTVPQEQEAEVVASQDDDDEDGWITPSNLKQRQAKDSGSASTGNALQKTLQAAILTSDYAMQNIALHINLNLVTPSLERITHLKNWVLRCHGCFTITKDMDKQFCPKCGQPTLTRTSCSTDSHGNFKLHLRRNFQWNNRGNVYSVPKPVHGSSNGRLRKNMGGKNNWGKDLLLAEDQKEHIKIQDEKRRTRARDIMDIDYLPSLLTGDRLGSGGRTQVGAGRNVNSRRKR